MSQPTRAFLFGPRLRDAIYRTTASGNVDCAVAFWGEGAEKIVANMFNRFFLTCTPRYIPNAKPIRLARSHRLLLRRSYANGRISTSTEIPSLSCRRRTMLIDRPRRR
jgi:hypothetical protein